jgi:prepilin-type N-terminal cleavage/methylation domain-containing protein
MKKTVRRGFTLPEVLVTVTVVAVLAAVVVPAVTQYASKGDSPATQSDVNQLVTAVTSFTSDVRKYPGDLRQLAQTIATSGTGISSDANTGTYSAADVLKWHGPYTPSTLTTSGYAMISGLQVQVGPALTATGTPKWLQVPVVNIGNSAPDCTSAAALDAAIDGGDGATAGRIQWNPTNNTSGTCTSVTNAVIRLIPAP